MRLLLDESVPSRLRRSLASHEVRTVGEMGWSGTKNGKLLALAGAAFDAFVTVDKNSLTSRTWKTLGATSPRLQLEKTMDLVHCIYCSASTSGAFRLSDLPALLEKCRTNNATCDVTGMLLYQNQSFFQVLEGDRSVVEALFDKVALDPRHTRVTRVILEPISGRGFASWTMGYPRVSEKDLATIPGLNDFFGRSSSYLDLGEGRAKTLLAAFKDGKWRMNLS